MMLTGVPPALSHISANCEPALYKTLLTISTHESGGKLASGLRSPLCAHRFFTKLKRCGPRGSLASSAHLSCLGIPSATTDHDPVIRPFWPFPFTFSSSASHPLPRSRMNFVQHGRGSVREIR